MFLFCLFCLQLDKERDVESMTQRIRKELNDEKNYSGKLLQDIESIKNQLTECQDGLLAAARISDEFELSELTNTALKEECKYLNKLYA